jgi:hypothetical protein
MYYLPSIMTPTGMIFYSFIGFCLISIHASFKRRTIETYVNDSLNKSLQRSVINNRKKKNQEADNMLKGLKNIG